jgi:type 1 glutamine amidotransferase
MRCWGLALVCGLAWLLGGTDSPGAGKERPIRVLFVLGSGPPHDIRNLPPILEKVLDRIGGFQVTRLEPPKDKSPADPAHLAKLAELKRGDYDVLLFYTVGHKLNDAQERALEQFVEEGGGLVALHGASASFGNSKVWNRLLGGRFAGHYKGLHKLNVVIADPDHPVTAGVGPFAIVDEEYNHNFAKVDRHVLARFRERPEGSKGKNMDVVWTRTVGKGRVVYNALGHGKEAWSNPAWQKLTVQAILWAAGRPRAVQIEAPASKP